MADRQRLVITNYSRIIAPHKSIVKEETAASSPMTGKVSFSKWLISTVRPQKVSLMFPLPCQYHAGRRGINREIKFRKIDFNRFLSGQDPARTHSAAPRLRLRSGAPPTGTLPPCGCGLSPAGAAAGRRRSEFAERPAAENGPLHRRAPADTVRPRRRQRSSGDCLFHQKRRGKIVILMD